MKNKTNPGQAALVLTLSLISILLSSCRPEPATDYQAFMEADPARAVLVLNGHSESISAIDGAEGAVYNDIQLVGYSGTNSAIPADMLVSGDNIYVMLSGQNSIEGYDKLSLDYLDDGRHYFKNGYNPMAFIPVSGTSWIFAAGFETDEVQPVNLSDPATDYSFVKAYEAVSLPVDAHSESKAAATTKNAAGDNKKRGSTGGAVYLNGADSRLYITNVRYDSSILLTEGDGSLAEYPADSGRYVKAGGYFREATLSIFGFNAGAFTTGASDSAIGLSLIKEINLESLYHSAAGGEYFPGDGLNPQSVFILDGRLNIVCTGTNGGAASYYSSSEYIPAGFSAGDEKPGTNPDDGKVIVLSLADTDNPSYMTQLAIGGSPAGFRDSIDTVRKIVYLAGVGGIQSYRYGPSAGDYSIIHSASSLLLGTDNPESDFYSGLCYDSSDSVLYVSFYSGDSVKTVNITGDSLSPSYSEGNSYTVGDGPGTLCILER